jgi:type I restriction enzyme R subunit
MYSNPESYKLITYENTLDIKRELAPLIEPEDDNAIALPNASVKPLNLFMGI